MTLDFDELRQLIAVLNGTDIAEVTLKSADFELTVRKAGAGVAPAALPPIVPTIVPTAAPPVAVAPTAVAAPPSAGGAPAAPPAAAPPRLNDPKLVAIKSPMVGTFYRAPSPEDAPFVTVGDRISSGQTVCIIEAMKLMNELEAEVSGEVVEILVENSQPVEFDQPLMMVRPA